MPYGPESETFSINGDDFRSKFGHIVRETIPSLLRAGEAAAGMAIIRDAILQEPRAPHKTGRLWNSQVFEIPESGLEITVGFNTEYAAKVHEAPEALNWTLKGSGPKYLSSKLAMNGPRYMEIVAARCRAGSAGGGTGGDIGGLKAEMQAQSKAVKTGSRTQNLMAEIGGWQ